MMDSSDDYLNGIKEKIKKKTGLSDVELQQKINEIIQELEFLSPDAALMQLAREYGIVADDLGMLNAQEFTAPILPLKEIIEQEIIQPSISVEGVVLRVYRPLVITSRQNPTEKDVLAKLILADDTARVMVLFWPPHSERVVRKEIRRGVFLRLRRVSSKKNQRFGNIELHTTVSSEIECLSDAEVRKFPNPFEQLVTPSEFYRMLREGTTINRLDEFDVIGTVVDNHGVRMFQRADQSSGKYGLLLLGDEESVVRVMFWDERSEEVLSLNVGDFILLEGVTVSINKNASSSQHPPMNEITVHVNKLANVIHLTEAELEYFRRQWNGAESLLSRLEKRSEEVRLSSTSLETRSFRPIADISVNERNVNLKVSLKKVITQSSFVRRDGTRGFVARALVYDEKAAVILVAWDEIGRDLVENCTEGSLIEIHGARVKRSRNGDLLEVHVNANGMIQPLSESTFHSRNNFQEESEALSTHSYPNGPDSVEWENLNRLDGKIVTVHGVVDVLFDEHIFEHATTGKRGKNRVLLLRSLDGKYRARVVIWNEKVDELSSLLSQVRSGTELKISWAKVKIDSQYNDAVNFHLRPESQIFILAHHELEPSYGSTTVFRSTRDAGSTGSVAAIPFLNGLEKGQTVECRVMITSLKFQRPYYLACPHSDCQKKLQESENKETMEGNRSFSCPVHGMITDPELKIVLNGSIDDGTATIPFVSFGKNSEKLLNDELVMELKEIIMTGLMARPNASISDLEDWFQKVKSWLLGREFMIIGYAVERKSSLKTEMEPNSVDMRQMSMALTQQVVLTRVSSPNHGEIFELITSQLI